MALAILVLFSSCYTGRTASGGSAGATLAGAAIGGNVGGLVGGLIGENRHGWHGGYRGSAIGTIVGTLAGAAIGNAASRSQAAPEEDSYVIERTEPARIEHAPRRTSDMYSLRIRNIRFIDDDRDHVISSGESSKVVFEIINEGRRPVYNVVPVATLTAGKRIKTGEIVVRVAVADNLGEQYDRQEFSLPTLR